jgi:hypothetical protein
VIVRIFGYLASEVRTDLTIRIALNFKVCKGKSNNQLSLKKKNRKRIKNLVKIVGKREGQETNIFGWHEGIDKVQIIDDGPLVKNLHLVILEK